MGIVALSALPTLCQGYGLFLSVSGRTEHNEENSFSHFHHGGNGAHTHTLKRLRVSNELTGDCVLKDGQNPQHTQQRARGSYLLPLDCASLNVHAWPPCGT